MAGNAGPVAIQGCAIRVSRLEVDGSVAIGASDMIQDDKSFVKFNAKPSMYTGKEFVPESGCGAPIIAYKDFDRQKRWDWQLDFGNFDVQRDELIEGGEVQLSSASLGRVVADGVTVENSTQVASALALFTDGDVGRSLTGTGIAADSFITRVIDRSRTVTDGVTTNADATVTSATAAFTAADIGKRIVGAGIPDGTTILSINSGTSIELSANASASAVGVTLVIGDTVAVLNNAATADGTGVSITLGALAASPLGYAFPALLEVGNPYGVSIEIWQKLVVRGTGYLGTTPYPSLGSVSDPALASSAFLRWGVFRALNINRVDVNIEDKESMASFTGFAIENPMFGTGPLGDWTDTAEAGGVPIDTTKWCTAMADFQLPSPLQPGYQTTTG